MQKGIKSILTTESASALKARYGIECVGDSTASVDGNWQEVATSDVVDRDITLYKDKDDKTRGLIIDVSSGNGVWFVGEVSAIEKAYHDCIDDYLPRLYAYYGLSRLASLPNERIGNVRIQTSNYNIALYTSCADYDVYIVTISKHLTDGKPIVCLSGNSDDALAYTKYAQAILN